MGQECGKGRGKGRTGALLEPGDELLEVGVVVDGAVRVLLDLVVLEVRESVDHEASAGA